MGLKRLPMYEKCGYREAQKVRDAYISVEFSENDSSNLLILTEDNECFLGCILGQHSDKYGCECYPQSL